MTPPPRSAGAPPRWAWVLLWVLPALWSSNYLIARASADLIGPHALAFGRWALALLMILPFVAAELRREAPRWRTEWRQALVLGGLGMWICGAFVYEAARTTTATNIALIYAAAPVAIAWLGSRLLGEPLHAAQRIGIACALAGVALVITRGDPAALLRLQLAPGDAWITVCTASWVAYSVLLRRWTSVLSPLARLAVVIGGGLVVMTPFTLAEALWWPGPALTWPALGLVLAAALVPGVISYAAYSFLQREIGAARTAVVLYLTPLYGGLGAWALLGERPGWHHLAGALLILPGVWLANRR